MLFTFVCAIIWCVVIVRGRYLEIPASGDWDGNDGPWSTFNMAIGDPMQNLRLLPSTISPCLMPFSFMDCNVNGSVSCGVFQGPAFKNERSNTYTSFDQSGGLTVFPLPVTRNRTYYDGTTVWGTDQFYVDSAKPVIKQTFIAEMYNVTGYSTGMFGVVANGLQIYGEEAVMPSLIGGLKTARAIDSRSWSYTAGSVEKKLPGSFVFGGYDESRFDPSDKIIGERNLSIFNNTAYTNKLYFSVRAISDSEQIEDGLLPSGPITMQINTAIPQIWLPSKTCLQFETAFNVQRNESHNLYLLDAEQATAFKYRNSTLNFRIAAYATSNDFVTINIPWSFLVLTITLNGTNHPYLPFQCTDDDEEYILGRAFLQAAHLTVNYDANTFSLSPARYPEPGTPKILKSITITTSSSSPSTSTILGAVLTSVLIIIAVIASYFLYKKRRGAIVLAPAELLHESFKPELAATPIEAPPAYRRRHSSNVTVRSEVDGTSTMLTSRLDTLSETNEPIDKPMRTMPVELEATPATSTSATAVGASELYAGYEGVEMKAEASPEDDQPGFVPYRDDPRDNIDEPISPLHDG